MRPDDDPSDFDGAVHSPVTRALWTALETAHGVAARSDDAAPPAGLESELLRRHAALYGKGEDHEAPRAPSSRIGARAGPPTHFGAYASRNEASDEQGPRPGRAAAPDARSRRSTVMPVRAALLTVALTASAGVAACTIPAQYELPLGWNVELMLPPGREVSVDEVLEAMAEISGSDQINVMLRREHDDDPLRLSLQAWTNESEVEATVQQLVARVPALSESTFERRPLMGTVHTSLAGELGFRVLGRADRREVGRARDQLRRRLHVDVRQITTATRVRQGSRETLEIRVERRVIIESSTGETPPDDGAESTASSPITF